MQAQSQIAFSSILSRLVLALSGTVACAGLSLAQTRTVPSTASPSPARTELARRPSQKTWNTQTLPLTVPEDTPVQVVLDHEVRLKEVGQPLRGRVVEPVYAFDKLVIPEGSVVTGRITKIDSVAPLARTISALDADFTPTRKFDVEFTDITLPDGKHLPISTSVSRASGQVIQFVSANANKQDNVKTKAEANAKEAKQRAKQQWDNTLKQVSAPGKVHRIERYGISLLPIHPQYIEPGTAYFAELREPLDFGAEPLTPELASSIGTTLPPRVAWSTPDFSHH